MITGDNARTAAAITRQVGVGFAIGAGAMAALSLSVVTNASRLRRRHPRPIDTNSLLAVDEPTVEVGTDNPTGIKAEQVTDPVCGMSIDPDAAAERTEHSGITDHFCSQN